jgi:hypothetical protein
LSAYKHLDQFQGTAKITTWLAVKTFESALQLTEDRYIHGALNVDTCGLYLRRLEFIAIKQRRLESIVQPVKALGGGWDVSQLPQSP